MLNIVNSNRVKHPIKSSNTNTFRLAIVLTAKDIPSKLNKIPQAM